MCNRNANVRRAYFVTALVALLLTGPSIAAAQHGEHADHAGHDGDAGSYEAPPVTDADRAAAFPDLGSGHAEHAMLDDPLNKLVLLDRLETQHVIGGDLRRWDLSSWVGKSLTKVWIHTEGEVRRDRLVRRFIRPAAYTQHVVPAGVTGPVTHAEIEVMWGKGFARWWDFVAGARGDFEPGPTQYHWAAVGVRGTTPYRVDLEATAYLREGGRTAFRVHTHYEVLVTNRLILQPLVELNWYGQRDTALGIGAGLAEAEVGLRLRYEVKREVAPYVGLVTERMLGDTAEFARAAGRAPTDTRFVAGIRLRF